MQLLASEVSTDYYTHPPGIVSLVLLTITHIQAMALHIHRQGRFNNYAVHSLYRIIVTAISIMGLMKMGNIVPKRVLNTTSLAFRATT